VMKHLFPNAEVPVVQLSIDMTREPQWHYDIGKALQPLRDQGVLIIGSGNVVHNLRQIDFQNESAVFPWAKTFNDHVHECIQLRNHQPLIDYTQGDSTLRHCALLSVPTPDHYYPLLYVLGASDANDAIEIVLDKVVLGSISMLSVKLGV